MKFNPTLPLALALSVGAAGAALAQTAANPATTTTPSTGYTQPATAYGQPQANAGYGQMQTPSTTGRTQASTSTPSAQGAPSSAAMRQPAPTAAAPAMASETAVNGNEQVRMAQQRLHAAGMYNGPEDGIMDPDTRAAIARYQEQKGLRRTESLDSSTLADLEGGQTTGYGSTTPPVTSPSTRPGTAAAAGAPSTPSTAWNPSAGAMGGNTGKASAR